MNETFVAEIRVRFADVDHAKIVYYPRFFHYFHIAFEELFEAEAGVSYPDVLDVEHVGFPTVRTEADYRSPARYGDVLQIHVTAARIGNKSMTLRYRGVIASSGELCVEGLVTNACVDMRDFKAQPIPDRYRTFFGRFLES